GSLWIGTGSLLDLRLAPSYSALAWESPAVGEYFGRFVATDVRNGQNCVFSSAQHAVVGLIYDGTSTQTYALNVSATNGTVAKNPDQPNYASGSQVVLTATPSGGYQFSGWSGDASGTQNPLTITVDSNKNITANFVAIP